MKSKKQNKKRSSPKFEEFLSPKSSEDQKKKDQRSSSAKMQTKVELLGEYIPPIPTGFGTLGDNSAMKAAKERCSTSLLSSLNYETFNTL